MAPNPLFDQATANWRPTSKERHNVFRAVLSAANSKAAKSGSFGGPAHGEACALLAEEELRTRVALMLAALIETREAINPHLTASCNAAAVKRCAMSRFVEEAAALRRGRHVFEGYSGQIEYDTHFQLAMQRERRRLHNACRSLLANSSFAPTLAHWTGENVEDDENLALVLLTERVATKGGNQRQLARRG